MKIKRQKRSKWILNMYKNYFGFHEPYKLLVDGTFCQVSLKYNIQIKEQLAKIFNGNIQCFTTSCVLAELDMLGSPMYGAKLIAQRFKIHACKHKKSVSAQCCLKDVIKDENSEHFVLATQDFELTQNARLVPGVPLVYTHQNNIVIDKLSKATLKYIEDVSQGKTEPNSEVQSVIKTMKMAANITTNDGAARRKRKGPKGPNPLSCMKSKKLKMNPINEQKSEQGRRRKRSRKQKTAHV